MEAEGGGDVHIRIDVVDVMEPKQQGVFVINFMPVVKGPVQEEEAKDELKPAGQGDHIQKAQVAGRDPVRDGQGAAPHD